ncbi:hypothetical protein HYH03_000531 [Edaphochlamys debaryana]|uniref:Phosphatidic acid phosphatase type 2/haloperoxidase domain-containing protein n=1 Tax=Edaphochlamys debaryana TaxID=47281 RepID=A0A835YFN3_9CHLO|nr:hypothetical protein HYH03_000531 [Edaphochlamys debaryana]|eukprot:KAG2502037.1 hypothetical protein HYH03_000531 [Edaphochlamys debaryana]
MAPALTSFTCLHYEEGDVVGKVLAYSALLPYLLIIHHASKFYSRREIHEGVIVAGFIINEGIARVLKQLFAHARPAETCLVLNLCDSHGMPSSHTSCIAFGLALHGFLAARHPHGKSLGTRLADSCEVLGLVFAAWLTGLSRWYLGYHSWDQVVAGGVLGLALGAVWYQVLLWPVWTRVCATPLGTLLHLKSTWDVTDPLREEAAFFRGMANKDQRKKAQ